jgi:hypothetical protein
MKERSVKWWFSMYFSDVTFQRSFQSTSCAWQKKLLTQIALSTNLELEIFLD